jgi:hypothetical protein
MGGHQSCPACNVCPAPVVCKVCPPSVCDPYIKILRFEHWVTTNNNVVTIVKSITIGDKLTVYINNIEFTNSINQGVVSPINSETIISFIQLMPQGAGTVIKISITNEVTNKTVSDSVIY